MAKPKLPSDPRDYFVHAQDSVSLPAVAELYKGKKGCSYDNLRKRCHKEKWIEQRDKFTVEIKVKADEIVVHSKAERIARQMEKVATAFELMIDNILTELPNLGATVQDGQGFQDRYHAESWKQGLASYLKPETQNINVTSDAPKIVGLPGINADSL